MRDLSKPLAPSTFDNGRGNKQVRKNSNDKKAFAVKVAQEKKAKADSILAEYKKKADAQKAFAVKVAQRKKARINSVLKGK